MKEDGQQAVENAYMQTTDCKNVRRAVLLEGIVGLFGDISFVTEEDASQESLLLFRKDDRCLLLKAGAHSPKAPGKRTGDALCHKRRCRRCCGHQDALSLQVESVVKASGVGRRAGLREGDASPDPCTGGKGIFCSIIGRQKDAASIRSVHLENGIAVTALGVLNDSLQRLLFAVQLQDRVCRIGMADKAHQHDACQQGRETENEGRPAKYEHDGHRSGRDKQQRRH